LGEAARESLNNNLLRIAIPYLNELCKKLGETVVLEMVLGDSGIAAYVAQGRQTISIRATIGTRLPTHAAAGSKAILAFSSRQTVTKFLKRKMSRITETTITDPEKFLQELETIKKEGIAYTREEIDPGVNAVAVPILTHDKQPVGAVSVVGPSWRVQCDKNTTVVAELSQTVSAISAHLR
jgi:DNA-binding IclR family transcriptional regulator